MNIDVEQTYALDRAATVRDATAALYQDAVARGGNSGIIGYLYIPQFHITHIAQLNSEFGAVPVDNGGRAASGTIKHNFTTRLTIPNWRQIPVEYTSGFEQNPGPGL